MNETMMRESNALTLEPSGLRQRAAAGIELVRESSIRGLARAVEFVLVFGAWLLLPLWPILFAAGLQDRDYLRRYRITLARMTGHIRAVWHTRAISRMVARRLTPPVRAVPERIVGNCTHCGRCCLDQACVFLAFDEGGRSRCQIYGKKLWKVMFANCGRYPVDGLEIVLYRCPGFNAVRDPEASLRRIIPLARAMRPAGLQSISAESPETTRGSSA
jgi:hypothetical protein